MAIVVLKITFYALHHTPPPPPPLPPPPPPPRRFSYHSPARGFPFTSPNGFLKFPKWISLFNMLASSCLLFRIAKSFPPLLSLKRICPRWWKSQTKQDITTIILWWLCWWWWWRQCPENIYDESIESSPSTDRDSSCLVNSWTMDFFYQCTSVNISFNNALWLTFLVGFYDSSEPSACSPFRIIEGYSFLLQQFIVDLML